MKKILVAITLLLIASPVFAGWQDTVNQPQYAYKAIAEAATTAVKNGSGFLHTITVTGGTAGTIKVYDTLSGTTSKFIDFSSTNALATYTFDVAFSSGCSVVTGSATTLTVSYL